MAPERCKPNLLTEPPPTSNFVNASIQTDTTSSPEPVDASTQTDKPTNAVTVEVPNGNYEEEIAAQTAIVDKAKEHYETTKTESIT